MERNKIYRRFAILLFILYILVLFKLLFFKITFVFSDIDITGNEASTFETLLSASNFIPLYKIYYYLSGNEPYLVGTMNIVGNVLLFVPMGFFLPFFFKSIKSGRQLLLTVAVMSLSLEVFQLLTTTGEFDTDDVILNTIGATIGYFLFSKTKKYLVVWLRK